MLDFIIKNVNIADGSGAPMYRSSVGVKEGKIAKISESIDEQAAMVIDADENMVLAPGFIDNHTHNDLLPVLNPTFAPLVLQGVTYNVCGNCGISAAPVHPDRRDILKRYISTILPVDMVLEDWNQVTTFASYMDMVKRHKPYVDSAALVGHGNIRIAVMGMEDRDPTPAEMEEMKALVREAMEAGAKGMSSGLIYMPGVFAKTEEIIELCKIVHEYGGVYTTHIHNESADVLKSVEEALEVARQSGVKLIVSHLKVIGDKTVSVHKKELELLDKARESGIDVLWDQYLYYYGSSTLSILFPPSYQANGMDAFLQMLETPEKRKQILFDVEHDISFENFWQHSGPDGILLITCKNTPQFNGKNLVEVAEELHIEPIEALAEIMLRNDGEVMMADRLCNDTVIEDIWRHPNTAGGSDGLMVGTGQLAHPRAYCNFVRIFETYVREKGVTTLEEAVRKITSLPADFLGLSTKGHVKEGYDADLVVFDKNTIGSDATFTNPLVTPRGICYVFVSGKMIVKDCKVVENI